jgi:hypothetical protein
MGRLLSTLAADYPGIQFVKGRECRWSPESQTITYSEDDSNENTWGILHELGHALLGHATYKTDFELLQKEMLAWEKAREIAIRYTITLSEDHIQDCLDSYRDWINKRSTCPKCNVKTISSANNTYQCFNCQTIWEVSAARHHRPYRRQTQKLPFA